MKALEILITVIMVLGVLVSCVGGIMFLIASFKESVWWGLAVLFLPFAAVVFLFMHWSAAKKGFLVQVLGFSISLVACVAGVALGATNMINQMKERAVPAGQETALGAYDDEGERSAWTESGEPSGSAVEKTRKDLAIGEGKYVGMTVKQAQKELGEPKAVLQADGKTFYRYSDVELISKDGTNVTSESRL